MRVLCAPDSFKESVSAAQAAEAMRRGVLRADATAELDLCPIDLFRRGGKDCEYLGRVGRGEGRGARDNGNNGNHGPPDCKGKNKKNPECTQ